MGVQSEDEADTSIREWGRPERDVTAGWKYEQMEVRY